MRPTRALVTLAAVAFFLASSSVASAANPWERADLVGQGLGGPTVATDGGAINRNSTGVTAKVSMPTPAPGSYAYPQGPTASGLPGHPEAFTLWVFIFFNPEACDGECAGPDLTGNPDVVAGAFNAGGHLVSGPNLTISGKVNQQSTVFGGANAESITEALALGYTIADAEIHLAIAPHGALDPHLLPEAIRTPVGNATFWWIGLFK